MRAKADMSRLLVEIESFDADVEVKFGLEVTSSNTGVSCIISSDDAPVGFFEVATKLTSKRC